MNLEKEVFELAVEDILPNRFQPREVFDDESINELAQSIKEHGVIQPIIVRKIGDKYEIVAGERRFRASKVAGKTTIPSLIRNIDDKESAKIALLENLQRKNLTAIEEAKTYQTILKLDNLTQEELANTLGKSQSTIANKLRLLALDESIQNALLNEQISERHARSLLNINDKEQQKQLLEKTILNRMTVKQLDDEIVQITGKKVEVQEETEEPIPTESGNIVNEAEIKSQPMNQTNIFSNLRNETIEPEVNSVETTLPETTFNNMAISNEIPSYGDNQLEVPSISDEPIQVPLAAVEPTLEPIQKPVVDPVIETMPPVEPTSLPEALPPTTLEVNSPQPEVATEPKIEFPTLPTIDQNIIQPTEIPTIPPTLENNLVGNEATVPTVDLNRAIEPIQPVIPPIQSQEVEPMVETVPQVENITPIEPAPIVNEETPIVALPPQPETIIPPTPIENVEPTPTDLFSNIDKLINEEINKGAPITAPVETPIVEGTTLETPTFTPSVAPAVAETTPQPDIYDLRFAINNFRQAVQNTEKFGFKIETEEFDFDNAYQFIIKIDKNK